MSSGDERVVEELGRVLASEPFVASPMLASFLRYVVEETLAGRGDRLKAYTVAVGALDRSDEFDPNDYPLVRVQARRLRQALERYYSTDGRSSDLVIELPLGTYVPNFLRRDTPTDAELPPRASETIRLPSPPADDDRPARDVPSTTERWRTVAAVLLVFATISAVGGWYARSWLAAALSPQTISRSEPVAAVENEPATATGLDATRVLPLLTVAIDVRDPAPPDFDAEVYRNRIEAFARRFDDVVVVTRRSADYPTLVGQPLYRLRFVVVREGGTTNAYVHLTHAGDERIVRSIALTLDLAGSPANVSFATPEDLAFVRDVVQQHGAISQDLTNVPEISPELACLTRAWNHHLESTPQSHREARDCLVPLVTANPRLVPALTMLGAVHLSEFRQNFNRRSGDPLVRAEQALRQAVRLAPASSAPYQVLESLLLIRGDTDAAVRAGAMSVQANPEDMNAVGGYGAVLARVGRYEEAIHLLTRAEANTAVPPEWMQFYAFLAFNNLGRTREADERVAFFGGASSSLYLSAAAIRAHRRGDEAAAAAAITAILKIEPSFREDPADFLRRRGLAAPVADRLLIDLTAAGLYRSRT